MIIDSHSHIGTRIGSHQTGAELADRMDAAGVDLACIFPHVEAGFSNDEVDVAMTERPDRFIPFMALNPWVGRSAVEELHRRADRGYRGIKLHPTIHGYNLGDLALLAPILDAARERALIVIAHGASDVLNAPPAFAKIARAYPEVPLLMAHSGVFQMHEEAIEAAREHPSLYLECARVPAYEISVQIRELGPEKVVWGSDSPFCDYTWEYQKVSRTVDSEEARLLVCGGNLARLLGL
ncbi:MAG: amidohydrolase family protein [Naasia sp.]|jgi:predicted TIM-barrel fold metal-dependent hydrolase|uniref:amidohydrolase family protein n=1 Tax=Naasia sp. TaxID=2546198 RepID=UPI00261F5790|nr:amidohydrolase family protein [Naasia sp.]MCU1569957.1 amidohydrolase family protein [Naasia sp.]